MSAVVTGPQAMKQGIAAPQPVVQNRLSYVAFLESVSFAGSEETSISVPGKADRLVPARLEADGSATPIDKGQRSDGVLLIRTKSDTKSGRMVEYRRLVPWANLKDLGYSE